MQIEVHGLESFLEEFRLHLRDKLEKNGYVKGPKIGYIETGHMETYTKRDVILSLQISEESEGRECSLHIESEQDVPELEKIWDNALVAYGKELIGRLEGIAQDSEYVRKGLKSV